MVTCVPGNNSCTACAITWAQSCRISSTPSSSSAVMTASSQLRSISVAKSTTVPSILSASAFFARLSEIDAANSTPVTGASTSRVEPSGRVSVIMCVFRFLCQNHKSPRGIPRSAQNLNRHGVKTVSGTQTFDRVATRNAAEKKHETGYRTVMSDSLQRIFGTGRLEPAARHQKRRYEQAVKMDRQ